MEYKVVQRYFDNGDIYVSRVLEAEEDERSTFESFGNFDTYIDVFATKIEAERFRLNCLEEKYQEVRV